MFDLSVRRFPTGFHVCQGDVVGSTRYGTIDAANDAKARMEKGLIRFEAFGTRTAGVPLGKAAPYNMTASGRARNTMKGE